jgi:ribosomal protein S3
MGKKTNSINLRSINNKNLKANVIFEKYNYSKLLYQNFYIQDFLENVLRYNFHDSIAHKVVIQRKKSTIYIFLDYYLFNSSLKVQKKSFEVFSIRKKFWWKKKKYLYRKYFDIRTHFRQKRVLKSKQYFLKKDLLKKNQKHLFLRSPLLRFQKQNSFLVFSFKRLILLNLMFLTGCKVKLYTRNVRRLLSLPVSVRNQSYKKKVNRENVMDIMRNFRIRGFVNNIKDLKVPLFIHLTYTSFIFKNPRLLGLLLGNILKKNIKMFRFFFFFCSKTLLPLFMFSNLNGLKIQFKGRLGTSLRKRTSIIQFGQMPLQSIDYDIKYSFTEAVTIYGTCGIKIWYYYLIK